MMLSACLVAAVACGGGGDEGPASLAAEGPAAWQANLPADLAASSPTLVAAAPVTGAGGSAPQAAAPAPASALPATPVVQAPRGSAAAALLDPSAGVVLVAPAASEDWAAATRKVQSSAAWAGWTASRLSLVRNWASTARDRPDLMGGWIHDYVDPVTGLPLTWTPTTPEPPEGQSAAEIRFKRAWVAHVRGHNIRQTLEAARLARLVNDAGLREWAASQLDFYAANYLRWPRAEGQGRQSRMFWNGIDEATASFSLVEAARLLSPSVPAARTQAWRTGLFEPLARNLMQPGLKGTNINLWHAAAVARIGMRFAESSWIDWGLVGPIGTRATLDSSLAADNLWNEGSFSYNAWMADALSLLVVAASLEGHLGRVAEERQALGRIVIAPLEFRFDDGRLPTPGDATPRMAVDAGHMAWLYRALPTWWGLNRAKDQQTWDTLLDPPAAVPASPVIPAVVTRDFPSVRMAVLRAGTWQAFVHYGQARPDHHQHEALSFELSHGMRALSIDPGTVAYGSPLHDHWFRRGASHNVPLVDGEGQATWSSGTVLAFESAPVARLRVRHAPYRPGVVAEREYRLSPEGFSERTTLQVLEGGPRRLGLAFLTACSLSPGRGLIAQPGAAPPANTATAHWQALKAYRTTGVDGAFTIDLGCGADRYTYRMAGSQALTVFLGQAPTTPLPGLRSLLYVEASASQASFLSEISAR